MAKSTINIALIGQKFMGKAHSNAWLKVAKFFDLPVEPIMHTVVGRNKEELKTFAARWGWQNHSTDWKKVISDPAIDLVDIGTPNNLHETIALAALKAGKAVACEKPLANTFQAAKNMVTAAKKSHKPTFVWFNYRRVPALALARQIINEGRLGKIYHVRAQYLQDWGGPETPLVWRFNKKLAGSGAHGDLNAHIVDIARFLTNQEITEVSGMAETFIKERPLPENPKKKGKSTVDDAVLFLARFTGGAIGSFEATRVATGNKNGNQIEINGEKGSLYFNFEQMNELMFYDASLPQHLQGWTNILATSPGSHPYFYAWWPDAHIIGYEHTFVNMAADICKMLGGKKPEVPMPDFEDALKTQQVLDAALLSAAKKTWIKVNSIK
ncbi:MAG: Gfo/Idh/MocA family oxidoreductase [Phycisphaerae bacterium]|nr:Gfo/Idh/MocA family oxidoreductase [Phycisphaerae bacterium]